jgi:hypothetical protein
MTKKASETALGQLHAAVATVLTKQLDNDEVSAATISAAITFLKNNNITADAEGNAELSTLAARLAEKRKSGKDDMANKHDALAAAAERLEKDLGGFMQ